MRWMVLVFVGSILITAAGHTQARYGTPADERAIQKLRDAHDAAWNRHDAKAIAALFAQDADRATVNGWFSGRSQIEQGYARTFSGAFKAATLTNQAPKLKFLTPDVAVLDVDNLVTGTTDGISVRNHSTSIYVKRNGEWTLVANRLIRMP
jgi:uncharacterized protein (TIGR02246 family)